MNYDDLKLPQHVAIILDGNGRWAKQRGYKRSKGHEAGFDNLKRLSKYIFSKNIAYLSVYAFSEENFNRSKEEVDFLMNLFISGFKKNKKFFAEQNIKVIFSGKNQPLRQDVLNAMQELVSATQNNTGGILNICLNYSGQSEIVEATKKIVKDVLNHKINIDDVDKKMFSHYLYQNLPEVDLMIRTSGELRLSNFMLWQNAYAEFYFPAIYFPDFDESCFDEAIIEYNKRDRRFGNIDYNKVEKNK